MLSQMKEKSLWLLNKIHYWIVPGHCILCQAPTKRFLDLCADCMHDLPYLNQACYQCALPLKQTIFHTCGQCLQKSPAYDRTIALFHYDFPINKLISDLKFHQRLRNASILGRLFSEKLRAAYKDKKLPQYIIPVPLHKKRLRERGYNQALELARPISKALNIPLNNKICERIIHTLPQLKMDSVARRKNLKHAFSVNVNNITHVAIIDDVMTTGSTVEEISRVLKKHGVTQVDVWCIGRTELG